MVYSPPHDITISINKQSMEKDFDRNGWPKLSCTLVCVISMFASKALFPINQKIVATAKLFDFQSTNGPSGLGEMGGASNVRNLFLK